MSRHPAPPSPPQTDPIGWSAAIALGFAVLVWWHLWIPSKIYFDEVHYVPAARKLLGLIPANQEHPLLAKEAIAAAIAVFSDHPLVWRIPSAIMGPLGLFGFGRALWWASGRRFAALAGMVLLATDFAWFIQSRIAMLDMVMAGFGMIALWQVVGAARLPWGTKPAQIRWRLALAGVCLGLAIGAKWSIVPAAALIGMIIMGLRIGAGGRRCLDATDIAPFPGLTLTELTLWLGSVPLFVYWATFMPAFFYHTGALDPFSLVQWHRTMIDLQNSVVKTHPYQSVWYQWVVNWRPIWYLYEVTDGSQRGILLLGNPFTMLAGLPALLWCLWAGLWQRRSEALACAGLYAVSLGMWAVSGKPVQFYYHYLLPGSFLMAALALALDAVWAQGGRWRWLALAALALATGMFAWFYPIIAAGALSHGKSSFEFWMWLPSWR